jgi:hypothetical protein
MLMKSSRQINFMDSEQFKWAVLLYPKFGSSKQLADLFLLYLQLINRLFCNSKKTSGHFSFITELNYQCLLNYDLEMHMWSAFIIFIIILGLQSCDSPCSPVSQMQSVII